MKQEIKNLRKAAEEIKRAIKRKENIILYGDGDLDGVSSVVILKESIKSLGGKVSTVYFPDREIEGYGLTEKGIKFLENKAPALIIVVDCGISNFKEVKLAKKNGFEVIIVDHHEVLGKLPEAKVIVDPKQKGDKYPFKSFAATGIVFKLSEILLENSNSKILKRIFLELVALATIADMMPQKEENKIFIIEGLSSIEKSFRPGIKSFFETKLFQDLPNLNQKVSKIISILNIRDIKNRLPASFRLLTTPSLAEAKKMVKELLIKGEIRKEKIEKIIKEVEKRIGQKNEAVIFEGGSNFEVELIGSVASIICRDYQKPTFLYKKMKEESQGTVRTTKEVNSVVLMKQCSKYPLTYGGHPQASGFRIKNKNLENFKKCLSKNLCVK